MVCLKQAGNQTPSPLQARAITPESRTRPVITGYRYYNPELGRWISRDPIGDHFFFSQYIQDRPYVEKKSIADSRNNPPYQFVENRAPNDIDVLGLDNPGGGGQNVVCCAVSPPPQSCIEAVKDGYMILDDVKNGRQDDGYGHCMAFCQVARACGDTLGNIATFFGLLRECGYEIREAFPDDYENEFSQDNAANNAWKNFPKSEPCRVGCAREYPGGTPYPLPW